MDEDTIKRDIVINIAKQIYIGVMSDSLDAYEAVINQEFFDRIGRESIEAAEAWYEAQLAYCKKVEDDSFA
jgi:uncharacterized protein YciU (UPF0263 family)